MKKVLSVMGNTIKVLVFLGLAAAILLWANFVLKLKSPDGNYVAQMFAKQTPHTVDVVFVGSSHIYTDVNPAVLWEEYGIASYALAGSNQPLWNTYYYMKEAIEKQSPELVVVDLYRAMETRDVIDDARIAMNTLGLAYGENRTENIRASIAEGASLLDYVLGYPIYHTRYEFLQESDFKRYNGDPNGENYKGFNENCISVTPFESFSDVTGIEDRLALTKKSEEYVRKIMELAKATETELLLIVAPYQGIMPSDKMIFNEAEALAKEYGVPYIDFNEYYAEIGLDPMRDCAESSHLNYDGSEKFSEYLGSYLKTRYSLPDRRGEDGYESWEKNAEHYERIAYYFKLRNTENLEKYLKLLFEAEGYTALISLDGQYDYGKVGVLDMLEDYGVKMNDGGVAVVHDGEVLFCGDDTAAEDYHYHMDWGSKTIVIDGKIIQQSDVYTGECVRAVEKSMSLDGINAVVAPHGVNVMIYDEYTNRYDSVGFDATREYQRARY